MSPSSREFSGPRPAPLKIHKDSHQIQKPTAVAAGHQQRQQPVIIYTHSPKVIHTQARDFMALVQKLTGLSRAPKDDDDDEDDDDNSDDSSSSSKRSELEPKPSPPPPPAKRAARAPRQQQPAGPPPAAAATFGFDDYPPFGNIAEIPMFTPADHFLICSPKSGLYRYSSTSSSEAKALPEF